MLNLGLLMLLYATTTWAQVATGTISGQVRDSTGGVLPGAQVIVLNEETGISRAIRSDAAGRYVAVSLSPGRYRVTGSLEGFQSEARNGIVLTVGREAVVDLSLSVGAIEQTVVVTGEAPLVESASASLGSLVDERTIRELPLNGRSYDQLALLQPGVILTSPGRPGVAQFKFGTGKRFTVGGQRSIANSFLLDGTNINDQANGTPGGAAGTNLGVDTVREFKIFTNSFKAEYGRSNGSVTTVVTRSGTNAFRGTAFEYIRNSALDARNFFDIGSVPSFKRNQFGGTFGGPIRKEKVFFYGGYEGLRERLGVSQIATVPTQLARQGVLPSGTVPVNPIIQPFLNLYPLPNGRDFGDGTAEFLSSTSRATNEDYFMARVDDQLSANTSIFGRYTFDDDDLNDPDEIPIQAAVSKSRRQYSTIQVNSILGPSKLNNFRFAFNRTNSFQDRLFLRDPGLTFIPGQRMGGLVIGGEGLTGSRPITDVGPENGGAADTYVYNVFQWADDFSYVAGRHALKAGVDIQRVRDNFQSGNFLRGTYQFNTFGDFLAARPATLRGQTPLGAAPYWGLRQTLLAFYAQDDFAITSRLLLNLGMRWEATTDPLDVKGQMAILPSLSATRTSVSDHFFTIQKKSFEPRVGLAWRLDESGKTVLRAGGGIYHNQILPWLYFNNISITPFFGTVTANNPGFPSGVDALRAAPEDSIRLIIVSSQQKTPVNYQYNWSIQREIFKDTVLQVAYAGNKANHLVGSRDADTAIPTILPDGQKFFAAGLPRRNTAWNGIRILETDYNSMYNSITFSLRRQSISGIQGQIFYNFSKAMDEKSATQNSESVRSPKALLDPEDRARDWGLADFDSKHSLVFNFSYPLPFQAASKVLGILANGWSVNSIGTFTTGLPLTPRLATSISRDRSSDLADRPDLKPGASHNPNNGTSAGCPGFLAGKKLGGADNFYDPCSFTLPLRGMYGNLGRNTIIGPATANLDISFEKVFRLSEDTNVALRSEFFNVFNHANFGLPDTTPLVDTGNASGSAGRIRDTTTSSRQIQFGIKISF